MDAGRPTAGHQQSVAGQCPLPVRQLDGTNTLPTVGCFDPHAGADGQAGGTRGLGDFTGFGPSVQNRDDADAGAMEIEGSGIGAIVGGGDRDRTPRRDRPTIGEGTPGAGQHDSRSVVVWKYQRAFDRAGRQNHLPRPHLPQAFPRLPRFWITEVIGQAFGQADQIVGIPAERSRARQQGDAAF